MTFSGKEAIPFYQIPEMIINLCQDLNTRLLHLSPKSEDFIEQAVNLLAWFQHRFVFIHPFLDYNGRLGRMLTALVSLNLGLPPIEIKASSGNDRRNYLQAMYAADEGDFVKLEKIIASALNESLGEVIRR